MDSRTADRRKAWTGGAAALVLASVSSAAYAAPVLLPDGEGPADTLIWVLDAYRPEPRLFGPNGAEVPLDPVEAPAVGAFAPGLDATERFPGTVWRPEVPLVVGETYEVRLAEPAMSTSFTVMPVSLAPELPPVPAVARTEEVAENTKDQSPCAGNTTELEGNAYTRLEVSTGGAFTIAYIENATGVADDVGFDAGARTTFFHVGAISEEVPLLYADRPAAVRFGAFDLAGRFSGWSEPYVVDPPGLPSGGCSVAAGGPALWLGVLLALRALRRRGRAPEAP